MHMIIMHFICQALNFNPKPSSCQALNFNPQALNFNPQAL